MTGTKGHIVVAAGGTGGHMTPAAALIQRMRAMGWTASLVSDKRGLAYVDWLDREDCYEIPASSLRPRTPSSWPRGLVTIARGYKAASAVLDQHKANVVIGFGGYPAFPTLLAGLRKGIPCLIHEQNAVIGRTNRFFLPWVTGISVGYPHVRGLEGRFAKKSCCVGNPVRKEILAIRHHPYQAPGDTGPIVILVTGGSQGAHVFSHIVPQAIALLPEALRRRLHIIQQTRKEDIDATRAAYEHAGVKAHIEPFFNNMAELLDKAHIVISRAGASSIAELTCAGRPSILVPYPFATNDHQGDNAAFVAGQHGARVIRENVLTADLLKKNLEDWIQAPSTLAQVAAAARLCGQKQETAADNLADFVLQHATARPSSPHDEREKT